MISSPPHTRVSLALRVFKQLVWKKIHLLLSTLPPHSPPFFLLDNESYLRLKKNKRPVRETLYVYQYSQEREAVKSLKSEAIHETGLSGNVVASFFPLIIFILLCFNVLSTVPRENRLADFLYIYIYFVGGRRQINKPVS